MFCHCSKSIANATYLEYTPIEWAILCFYFFSFLWPFIFTIKKKQTGDLLILLEKFITRMMLFLCTAFSVCLGDAESLLAYNKHAEGAIYSMIAHSLGPVGLFKESAINFIVLQLYTGFLSVYLSDISYALFNTVFTILWVSGLWIIGGYRQLGIDRHELMGLFKTHNIYSTFVLLFMGLIFYSATVGFLHEPVPYLTYKITVLYSYVFLTRFKTNVLLPFYEKQRETRETEERHVEDNIEEGPRQRTPKNSQGSDEEYSFHE